MNMRIEYKEVMDYLNYLIALACKLDLERIDGVDNLSLSNYVRGLAFQVSDYIRLDVIVLSIMESKK